MSHSLNRRTFLSALGLGTAAAAGGTTALLGAPRSAYGQTAGAVPKRLILTFSSGGTIRDAWLPPPPAGTAAGATSYNLAGGGQILGALDAHRTKMLVLDGVNNLAGRDGPGGAHQKGMGTLWTGNVLLEGTFAADNGGTSGFASGPSIDQTVADAFEAAGRSAFRSLEFGVQVRNADNLARMSFRAANQPNPPMEDPRAAFDRIFSGLATDTNATRIRAQRRSVLDFVRQDITTMSTALGGDDRRRLDAHLTALREIELRLAMTSTGTCTQPTLPGGTIDPRAIANYPAVTRMQIDIMVAALACGLTRVASLQWSKAVSAATFPWLSISEGHHALSHAGDADTVARTKLIAINRWYAQQMAYLCDRLAAIPERDGRTLLDHTQIVWGNELGKGNSHSRDNIPFVLLGGSALRTGRYVKYNGLSSNNLYVSVANAVGVPMTTFGNARYCTGVLPNLT